MAITLDKTAAGTKAATTGTTFTIALSSTVGSVVFVAIAQPTGSSAVSGVTDAGGNTYHKVGNITNTVVFELWKTDKVNGAASGTITVTVVTGHLADASAVSYNGVAFAGSVAATASAATSPITSSATALRETLGTGWLLFGAGESANNAFTAQNGSIRQQGGGVTGARSIIIDSNGSTGTVTDSATMTANAWGGVKLELRPLSVTDALTITDGTPVKSNVWLLIVGCPHLGQNWLDAFVKALIVVQTKVLADSWNGWLDSVSTAVASGGGLTLTVSDNLNNWLDVLNLGYGSLLSDNLNNWSEFVPGFISDYGIAIGETFTLSDRLAVGYGSLVSDSMNNWLETFTTGSGALTLLVSDNLNNWLDVLRAGYGNLTSDQLILVDSLSSGYGALLSDNLNGWQNLVLIGYGNLTSDQLVLVDSLSSGYGLLLSDNLNNWLDSVQLSGPASLVLSDNLNNWSDTVRVGYGAATSDQLIIVDSLSSGYGALVSDSLNNWLDSLVLSETASLVFSDNLNNWLDFAVLGYGNLNSDQLVITDSASMGYGFLLNDNLNSWLDLVGLLFGLMELITDDMKVVFSSDGSSLTGWTNNGVTIDNTNGNPIPSFLVVPGKDAHITAGTVAGCSIQFDLFFYNATSALCNFYFGCNSSGAGYVLRLDGRGTGQPSGITASVIFTTHAPGAVAVNITTLVWHNIVVVINASGTQASWFLDGVLKQTVNLALGVQGPFIGMSGDNGSNGANFDNISVIQGLLDGVILGYGDAISDQLVLVDSLGSGYGNLLSDSMNNWLDSVTLSGPSVLIVSDSLNNWFDFLLLGYGDLVSDPLSLSDKLSAGYGNLTSDQMVILDSNSIGYGFLLSDNLNNWLDSVSIFEAGTALALTLSDNLNNWLEFLLAGYGSATSDQLVLVDSASMGYGFLLSDNLNNWSDLVKTVLGMLITLSDSESANWLDFLQAGFGSLMSDQLVIVDSLSSGYGSLISDSMNHWLDLVLVSEGEFLLLADSWNVWLDSLLVGYGDAISDQLVILDSLSIGYGLLISDNLNNWFDLFETGGQLAFVLSDNLNNWLDTLRIGYGAAASDQMVIVDSASTGYGLLLSDNLNSWIDSVTLVEGLLLSLVDSDVSWLDALSIGYGMLVSDNGNNWTDLLIINSGQPLIQLSISDNLNNWLDALLIGYGSATSDQLVILDSMSTGYGLLLSDSLNNWLDLVKLVEGLLLVLVDTESAGWLDSLSLGYGMLISDNGNNWIDLLVFATNQPLIQLTVSDNLNHWLDFLLLGYGNQNSDQIILADSLSSGYGALLSDSLNNWLSLLGVGYGDAISDAFTGMLDRIVAGFGMATSDQLVLLDSSSTGYGLVLSDNLNNWLDLLQLQLISPGAFTLTVSDNFNNWADALRIGYGLSTNDAMVWIDVLGAGYGSATSDSMVQLDSILTGVGVLFSDGLSHWLEAISFLEGDLLQLTDSLNVMDQLATGYGLLTTEDMLWLDSLKIGYGFALVDNLNNWKDLIQFFSGTEFIIVASDDMNSWLDALAFFLSTNIGPAKYFQLEVVLRSQFTQLRVDQKAKLLNWQATPSAQFTQLRVDQRDKLFDVEVESKPLFYRDQKSIQNPALFVGDTMNFWQDQLAGAMS